MDCFLDLRGLTAETLRIDFRQVLGRDVAINETLLGADVAQKRDVVSDACKFVYV